MTFIPKTLSALFIGKKLNYRKTTTSKQERKAGHLKEFLRH
jgi:hypothetical protein